MDELMRRREMMTHQGSPVSPIFYDYLKGDGTAYLWIDLFQDPEPPANNRILTIEATPFTTNGYPVALNYYGPDGTVFKSYGYGLYRQSSGRAVKYYCYGAYNTLISSGYSSTAKYKVVYTGGQPGMFQGYVDGVLKKTQNNVTNILPCCMFAVFNFSAYKRATDEWWFNSGTTDAGKVYTIRVEDAITGDYLVDLKPCLYGGQAGLWDTVSQRFFGNSNSSGTLTVGND